MDYGMMIFHHRKKLGWTQEKLCEGICSVSHLSKIENGTKEAGIETIELLLKKMRVEIDENDSIDEVTGQLKRLWNSIERADYDSSKMLFDELIGKEESINFTNISNDFCITIWRYYIFIEDLKMAKKKWKQLEAKKKKFSQYETIKYLFTLSIYYIKEKRYNDSLLVMDEVQEITPNLEIDFQEYCFYRALVYSFINQTSLSMYFCNKSIPIFLQNNNIKRILDAKMLLSLQLIKSKFLDRAEQFLIEILDSSVILSDKTIHMSALHNLGYLYYHSNQHKKAIKYYQEYLSNIQEGTEEYFLVISNIANNMMIINDYETATELLCKNLSKIKDKNSASYIRMKVLLLEAKKDEANLVTYLREVGLPLWVQTNDHEKLIKYYDVVTDYYEKHESLEKQNMLYKEYNSTLLKIIESRK
ncbi:helix-turn-helix domain-containing protein [Gottfriedia acidiceleris]|uniref:Helix-turn-helix domain-containing protein n=1 Tax=Gottfriedia acidiceleris TaxID=371036 RepID=A0ABY4JKN9_9BACI|nr:helix-turn-helix domain-containing protein [Gottfriedia acidiceleris]UPM53605.1 helix-turn-helix domain-containing protein [Gottfriedia acidiceleris]